MTTPPTSSTVGPAKRKRAGSGWSYTLGGEPVDSVSRIVDAVAKPGLVGWAAKTVAGYAVDHWNDLELLTPSKRLEELKGAAWADRDAAAGRGSDIHALAHQLALGETVEVPDPLRGHVDAYLAFVDAYDVHELAVETACVYRGASLATSYAGTFDALVTCGASAPVGLVDWKTGASGIWPETALQLAGYAHAQTMLVDGGPEERPMPDVDFAWAVWLRADGYDVVPVDISDQTWLYFRYAQQLKRFADTERAAFVHDALTPPKVSA